MDFKEKISEIVERIVKDDNLIEDFNKEPVKTVERVAGVDLPDEITEKVIELVKSKISVDKVTDALGSLKKLF